MIFFNFKVLVGVNRKLGYKSYFSPKKIGKHLLIDYKCDVASINLFLKNRISFSIKFNDALNFKNDATI